MPPCGTVHLFESEDSDRRIFNNEPAEALSSYLQTGFDIAKRFHEAAIIDRAGKVVVKRIRFANSHAGFLKLMDAVKKLDAPAEFGMEATYRR